MCMDEFAAEMGVGRPLVATLRRELKRCASGLTRERAV